MKKLLVIVDYQNDFVTGSLGHENCLAIYPSLLEQVAEFERNKDDIIFTSDTHDENYMSTIEGQNLPVPHCIKGTNGHKFYGELEEISKRHLVVEKDTFPARNLYEVLKNKEYESIIVAGVVTNICVISNAIILKSIFPNTPIIINTRLCASNDKKLEEEAYDIMRNLHFEVIRPIDFVKTNEVMMGDLLRVQRQKGYYHFGVAISCDRVVHFTGQNSDNILDNKNNQIIETSLDEFLRGDTLEVKVPFDGTFTREEIKARALRYKDSHKFRGKYYNVMTNNCEHFARYCYYGKASCDQVKEFKDIASTAATNLLEGVINKFN